MKRVFVIEHYAVRSKSTEEIVIEADNIVDAARKFTKIKFSHGDTVLRYEVESIKSIRAEYRDMTE